MQPWIAPALRQGLSCGPQAVEGRKPAEADSSGLGTFGVDELLPALHVPARKPCAPRCPDPGAGSAFTHFLLALPSLVFGEADQAVHGQAHDSEAHGEERGLGRFPRPRPEPCPRGRCEFAQLPCPRGLGTAISCNGA